MTTRELIEHFGKNHQTLIDYVHALTDDEFVYSYNTKWTPGQQLGHIYLCLKPMAQALASKDFILHTFGKTDRPTLDYNTIIDRYKTAHDQGGKAPDRFIPEPVDPSSKEGLIADLSDVLGTIQQQLETYSEGELDT